MITDCEQYLEDPFICDDIGEPKGQCMKCGYKLYEHSSDALPEDERASALEIREKTN